MQRTAVAGARDLGRDRGERAGETERLGRRFGGRSYEDRMLDVRLNCFRTFFRRFKCYVLYYRVMLYLSDAVVYVLECMFWDVF